MFNLITFHKPTKHYAIFGHNKTGIYLTEIDLVRELKNYPYNIDLQEWQTVDQFANNSDYELVNIWQKMSK